MNYYIINENVTDEELKLLRDLVSESILIERWPAGAASVPNDILAAILIIRKESSALEDARAVNVISDNRRIVCVHLYDLPSISPLAEKYCSLRVSISSGNLGEALSGNIKVQENYDKSPSPQNKQKPHDC